MYLTKRQNEIFEFLKTHIAQHGYAPTFDEIASNFSFNSNGTVYKHIQVLQKKGLIKHEWNRTRAIEIEMEHRESAVLPVLGTVTPKQPFQVAGNIEQIEIPNSLLGSGGHYLLRAAGFCMAEDFIMDNDYIVVQEKSKPENGDTVLALIDKEKMVIRKFYRKNGTIELRSASDKLPKLRVNKDRIELQGEHSQKVRQKLEGLGYAPEQIQIRHVRAKKKNA